MQSHEHWIVWALVVLGRTLSGVLHTSLVVWPTYWNLASVGSVFVRTVLLKANILENEHINFLLFSVTVTSASHQWSSQLCIIPGSPVCLVYRTINLVQDQLQLQRDLDSLTDWTSCWGMSFNPSKCTIITISRSNYPLHKFYMLCGVVLQHVSKARYLGVLLSDDLQWSKHVQHITAKANSMLGLLQRNFHHCPEKLRELTYTSLVRSRLKYCAAVWDPHKISDQLALESVQRGAARFTKRDYSYQSSVSQMIQDLQWQPLKERRCEIRLTLFF